MDFLDWPRDIRERDPAEVIPGAGTHFKLEAGGTVFTLRIFGDDPMPGPKVEGDKIIWDRQTLSFRDGNLVLGKMAGPWK